MEQYKNKGMQRARGETTIELLREKGGSDQRSLVCTMTSTGSIAPDDDFHALLVTLSERRSRLCALSLGLSLRASLLRELAVLGAGSAEERIGGDILDAAAESLLVLLRRRIQQLVQRGWRSRAVVGVDDVQRAAVSGGSLVFSFFDRDRVVFDGTVFLFF